MVTLLSGMLQHHLNAVKGGERALSIAGARTHTFMATVWWGSSQTRQAPDKNPWRSFGNQLRNDQRRRRDVNCLLTPCSSYQSAPQAYQAQPKRTDKYSASHFKYPSISHLAASISDPHLHKMAGLERAVQDFYQVQSLNPLEWPADKNNDSDVSEDENVKKKINRRKSRYQALERAVSTRSSIIPGSESSASGVSNLVQRDEPDPLGTTDSVVQTLKRMGLPIQEDIRLR